MSSYDPLSLIQPAATRVRDPLSGRSLWLAGIVQNPSHSDGVLTYELKFQGQHSEHDRQQMTEALEHNLRGLGFSGSIDAKLMRSDVEKPAPRESQGIPGMSVGGVTPHGGAITKKRLDGVQHIIAVASGKGGVGKSTVAVNLSIALQRAGHSVGLIDLDVYGPSLPTMMNVSARPMVDQSGKIVPVNAYGVRCISMGLLVDEEQAMIWRGPMIMGVLRQFLQDVHWSGVDYLVVDLPPGTGDAQLSLIQSVDLSGAVIVTTPQKVALADAVRGISMFKKLNVPILGLVENMAYYPLPDGTRDYVFGEGGGRATAARFGVDVLGELPLRTDVRKACDQGLPTALGDSEEAGIFADVARQVASRLPLETA